MIRASLLCTQLLSISPGRFQLHFWCRGRFQDHAEAVLWTERDQRLGDDWIAWYKSWDITLKNSGGYQLCLQLGKRHADADALTSTKGELGPVGCLLSGRGIPALWSVHFGVAPDIGETVESPLAEHEYGASREVVAIEIELCNSLASLCPG